MCICVLLAVCIYITYILGPYGGQKKVLVLEEEMSVVVSHHVSARRGSCKRKVRMAEARIVCKQTACSVAGPVVSFLCTWLSLVLMTTPWGRCCYFHFRNGDIEYGLVTMTTQISSVRDPGLETQACWLRDAFLPHDSTMKLEERWIYRVEIVRSCGLAGDWPQTRPWDSWQTKPRRENDPWQDSQCWGDKKQGSYSRVAWLFLVRRPGRNFSANLTKTLLCDKEDTISQ